MMNKRGLIIGGILIVIGGWFLIASLPALVMLRAAELSNEFIIGSFAAAVLQLIIAITLLGFAVNYLRKTW